MYIYTKYVYLYQFYKITRDGRSCIKQKVLSNT